MNDKSEYITNICRIAQGLLASGHYTDCNDNSNATDAGDAPAWVRTCDHGREWKKECHSRRYEKYIVEDAIDIYDDIIRELEHLKELEKLG
jgi:hypothetical protein